MGKWLGFVFSLVLGSASFAWACPDFTGVYQPPMMQTGDPYLKVVQPQGCMSITLGNSDATGKFTTPPPTVYRLDGTVQENADGSYSTLAFSGNTIIETPVNQDGSIQSPPSRTLLSLSASGDFVSELQMDMFSNGQWASENTIIFKRIGD